MGIFNFLKDKIMDVGYESESQPQAGSSPEYTKLQKSHLDNMTYFQGRFDGCADFVYKELMVCGRRSTIMTMDNMVDKMILSQSVIHPLLKAAPPQNIASNDEEIFKWLRDSVLSSADQHEAFSYEEIIGYLMSGFSVLLFNDLDHALVFGIQGFKFRSIDEPNSEQVLRGSREGFVEPLHFNMMLIRRRMKNPNLKFEIYNIGKESKTEICISYLKGVVSEDILNQVRHRMKTIDMDTIFESGYIQTFFQEKTFLTFSTVGTTERPDTFCGKLSEGRIGILVDNTPVALTTPYLFVENFQNMDDYAVGPYYATFTRILKYLAFFTSVLVPGLYVAIGSFHQSVLPPQLLYTLAQAEESTPFNLVIEAFLMQIIYEMVREAGLRLPNQFGSAISIVGALIIGQAAVSAGLIGAPMVIIVALTATSALVTPSLYETGVVLRFFFILMAGMEGLYGVTLGIALVVFNMCSLKAYDVPYTAPIAPLSLYAMRDVVLRLPWSVLKKRKVSAQEFPGNNVDQTQS